MKPVQVSWYIDVALTIGTVRLSVMPITWELWESISNMRSPWANDALNELRCCNVFTFAKRGFSSSIGYLAFDLSQRIQDATYESVLKAALDEQARITFVMSYSQEQVAEYTIGGLYGASLRVVYPQHAKGAIGVLKLVDPRYEASLLAPKRTSTHSFSTYSSDNRARDLFYTGMLSPDWVQSGFTEYPTLEEQLYYWHPEFRNFTIAIPSAPPFTDGGIPVSPQSETAWGAFRRIVEYPYDVINGVVSDLVYDASTGNGVIQTNIPIPIFDLTSEGGGESTHGFYDYRPVLNSSKFEVLFPLNRKNVWNTESVPANFAIVYRSPYTQPTRVPSAAYIAYYPRGLVSGSEGCISIVANADAVPTRTSYPNGPDKDDVLGADKYDFDWSTLSNLGDAEVYKYLYRSKAYSFFQSKVINGYADPYSYGSFPELISGARFTWHAWDISTELFFSTRLEVRERPGQPPFVGCGEPCADPFKQIPSPSPEDANLDKRQLGEQAFEELTIPYSSWTGHTEVCIYGHSIYSGGGDFTPVSEADCDALYGIGEVKLEHARLDEVSGSEGSFGLPEDHVLAKSRDLQVGVNFVGYMTNDGVYRVIDQPSIRVSNVEVRWHETVVPSEALDDDNMNVKFLTPYFDENQVDTGYITNPTNLLGFDRRSFRVFGVSAEADKIQQSLYPADAVIPTMAFITSANRVMLGQVYAPSSLQINPKSSGIVRIIEGTPGSEHEINYSPSGYVEVVAFNHNETPVLDEAVVLVAEYDNRWYIVTPGVGLEIGKTTDVIMKGTKGKMSVYHDIFPSESPYSPAMLIDVVSLFGTVGKDKWVAAAWFPRLKGWYIISAECG